VASFNSETYRRERLNVDGNVYEYCVFEECTFIYHGGEPPVMTDCTVTNPTFGFEGAARATLAYLRMLYRAGLGDTVEQVIGDIRKSPLTGI
jgi:hypothetical protein